VVGRDVPGEDGDADKADAEQSERDEESAPLDRTPEQIRGDQDQGPATAIETMKIHLFGCTMKLFGGFVPPRSLISFANVL
jgi:hypothetical protein